MVVMINLTQNILGINSQPTVGCIAAVWCRLIAFIIIEFLVLFAAYKQTSHDKGSFQLLDLGSHSFCLDFSLMIKNGFKVVMKVQIGSTRNSLAFESKHNSKMIPLS